MDVKNNPRALLPKFEPSDSSEPPNLDYIPAGTSNGPGSTGSGAAGTNIESSTKRRCISSACMPCRKRKSKCNGVKPSCNACLTVYNSQCYYDIDSDHRRKGALKRDIAQLKEELNAQSVIVETIRKGSEADVDDIIQLIRANPEDSYDAIAENIQKMLLSKPKPEPISGGLEGELAGFTAIASSDKVGQVAHYGHTSNLALGLDADHTPVFGDQLGSWTNVTNDPELFQHLLDVYFAWAHPYYLLFSEEVFSHGLRDRKLKYCTPLLVNAILAIACHFSDRPEARADPADPNTIGSHFMAEAKRLYQEDDRSCLTTIQALGLMSLKQVMHNQDGNGWQYAGQMMSMTVQCGLHLSSPLDGKMTPSEIEARRVTFWGVFVLETIWAVCVGRISTLPRAAIRLEKPGLLPCLENKPWKPFGQPGYNGGASPLEQPGFRYTMLLHNSLMSELVDDIVHMFYAPQDRITSRKLQRHHEKLLQWYSNLPECLRIKVSGPTLPQIIALHMAYHNCVIQLFRPFLRLSFVQDDMKSPRQICCESANELSQLTSLFTQTYGLRRPVFMMLHCVQSAAIIHLVNISSTSKIIHSSTREKQESWIAEAIHFLHQAQQCSALSGRYVKSLKTLIYKWCTDIPIKIQNALRDTDVSLESNSFRHSQTTIFSQRHTPQFPAPITTRANNPRSGYPQPPQIANARKHSAPDLVQMAPPSSFQLSFPNHPSESLSLSTNSASYQEQLFWTPFPDAFDGIPLSVQQGGNGNVNGGMSVADLLGGEFPMLSQDGFIYGDKDAMGVNHVIGMSGNGQPG